MLIPRVRFHHPLANAHSYDGLYFVVDQMMQGYVDWSGQFAKILSMGGKCNLAVLYNKSFILMFFISYFYHITYDTYDNYRKLVMGMCLILLVGGVSYWFFPVVGPFTFYPAQMTVFSPIQNNMFSLYTFVTCGQGMPIGYFTNAPAAMPSLHVAHSFFLNGHGDELPALVGHDLRAVVCFHLHRGGCLALALCHRSARCLLLGWLVIMVVDRIYHTKRIQTENDDSAFSTLTDQNER